MAFNLGALTNFFGLADEEEYDYPETQKNTQATTAVSKTPSQQQATVSKTQPQPQKDRSSAVQATYRNESVSRGTQQRKPVTEEKKVIDLQSVPKNTVRGTQRSTQVPTKAAGKITIVEPRAYSETMNIAKRIIGGEALLVNFHLVEESQARRIVDFLTGTVYALDGDIKRVGDEIFLCTPTGMEIDSINEQSFEQNSRFGR